ncbi:hypothetical protein CK203_014540 [Vitis vinifera]|uniref:Peptidase S9A N-terminal domain-containing protein n=1 Tax=Vitis vinifera TaxID=29760 RepID=A0A438K4K7_VITVI|nr:hypothetical protein CK203_014540 [Vitis vinifera]
MMTRVEDGGIFLDGAFSKHAREGLAIEAESQPHWIGYRKHVRLQQSYGGGKLKVGDSMRTLAGKEYVQHCRRLVSPVEALPSVYDTMPTGPDAPQEHVILDENTKAQEHTYYSIGAFKVSPNNKLVAYAEDTKGDEIYTVYIIDAETRTPVGKPLVRITSDLEWAGNEALLYITMDEVLRPDKV